MSCKGCITDVFYRKLAKLVRNSEKIEGEQNVSELYSIMKYMV
jgi:hypothetical protein